MKTKPEPALDIDSAELVVLELSQNKKSLSRNTFMVHYQEIER